MRRSARTLAVAAVAALSLGVAACGSSSDNNNKSGNATGNQQNAKPKTGGKLTVLWWVE